MPRIAARSFRIEPRELLGQIEAAAGREALEKNFGESLCSSYFDITNPGLTKPKISLLKVCGWGWAPPRVLM